MTNNNLEQWTNYLVAQLDCVVTAKNDDTAQYHAGVYLRATKKLQESSNFRKYLLGNEARAGYFIALKNYDGLTSMKK